MRDRLVGNDLISMYSISRGMIKVWGVSVIIYFLFLFVLGCLLFLYSAHGLKIEGFQVASGSGSGTYMSGSQVFVRDCTGQLSAGSGTQCTPLTYDTDRLTYLQRLPVGGSLVSANGRYSLKYRPDGMLVLYDISTTTVLWSSNTKGSSTLVPSYLTNIGVIQARSVYDTVMPWVPVSSRGSGSGSSSGSGSGSQPTYSIPTNNVSNTTIYLQVTDYGDVVVLNSAGSTLWRTGTGSPPVASTACVPIPMEYPFTQEDCFDLKSAIAMNTSIVTGASNMLGTPLVAETSVNTYMPLYAYIFGDYCGVCPVSIIKNIGGVNVYIAEQGGYLKMVADDAAGTARAYNISTLTPWSGAATSWLDTYWTSGAAIGVRTDGHYMLYLEGAPIQCYTNPTAVPALLRNTSGRIISMYGDYVLTPTTRKWPVTAMKTVAGVDIYMIESFARVASDTPTIKMVANDAVGTAKYIVKTGTISIGTWDNSYWTTGVSVGTRADAHYMIDIDDAMGANSGSSAGPTATSEVAAAKQAICNLQPYYNDNTSANPYGLGCAAYLVANPNPSSKLKLNSAAASTVGGPPVTLPNVGITGSISNLSNQATTNGDLTQSVRIGDMIYFGYLLDVQGPFVVQSITSSTITFTKKYIGPNLMNSIMSVVSSVPFTGNPASSTSPVTGPLEPNQKEVYVFGVSTSFTLAIAQTACASFGGTVATYNQMLEAYSLGAHWCWWTLVQDDTTGNPRVVLPIQTSGTCASATKGVSETTGATSGLACYGIKPSAGIYTVAGPSGAPQRIPILPFASPFQPTGTPNDSSIEILYNAPKSLISGSVYAGTSYITTTNAVLPDNLNIGDLIYIEGACNPYDTDLGDGTCRAYDCNPGQVDTLQNNQCRTYKCRDPIGNQATHTKNADGTCTVPVEYTPCPKTISSSMNTGTLVDLSRDFNAGLGDTVTSDATGNICTYTVGIDTTTTQWLSGLENSPPTLLTGWKDVIPPWHYFGHPRAAGDRGDDATVGNILGIFGLRPGQDLMTYSVKQTIKNAAFNYDVIAAGVPDAMATKTASNPSYTYPKTIGPFIVAAQPSINNILVRTYRAGDLDSNGKFLPISSSVVNSQAAPAAVFASANAELTRANAALVSANTALTTATATAAASEAALIAATTALNSIDPMNFIAYIPALNTKTIAQNQYDTDMVAKLVASFNAANARAAAATAAAVAASAAAAAASVGLVNGAATITNRVPALMGRQNIRIYKAAYDKVSTSGSTGSSGSMISLNKKVLGCAAGTSGPSCTPCAAGQSSTVGGACMNCAAGQTSVAGGACTNCSAGQSSTTGGACTNCPAGQSSTAGGACTNCPAGQSSISGGACRNCAAGQSSTAGGTCTNCPAGQSSTAGGTCTPCAAGQSSVAGGPCTSCAAGFTCVGGTAAIPCPPGQSSTGGGACTPCSAGYYCAGGTAPVACPPGQSSTGGGACSPCSDGYYCAGGAAPTPCAPGYSSVAGGACTPCTAGYYCAGGAAPFACPPGQSSVAGGPCTSCTGGYYCVGAAAPVACSPGYSSLPSSINSAACTACSDGYYCAGGAPAVPCGPGFTSTAGGVCTICAAGYYCTGGTMARQCTPGQSSRSGAASCLSCTYGTYSSSYGASSCTDCDVGQTTTQIGASSCTPCQAGYSSPILAYGVCTRCAAGTSTSGSGGACSNCPAGQSSIAGGPCTPCGAGTYSLGTGGACIPCSAGYSSPSGATSAASCTPCAAGYSSSSGGTCSICPPGKTSVAGGVCTNCPAGQSSVAGGVCTNCPTGQSSVAGGTCGTCPAGTSATSGQSCTTCPTGQSSVAGGICVACPAGQMPTINGTCTPCSFGYSCPGGSSIATVCSAGRTSNPPFISCIQCSPGRYSSGTGGPCIDCPIGTYATYAGTGSCTPCPTGTTTSTTAATSYFSCR